MESECSTEINNSRIHDPGKVTNAFMFTEDQITKQLVDMREQTDFMKKFRCALGIALREIKTLRTTASLEHSKIEGEELSSRKRHSSCSLPSTSTCSESDLAGTSLVTSSVSNVSSADSRSVSCICDDNGDLAILKEYLSKMTLEESVNVESKRKSHNVSLDVKSGQRENLGKQKDPGTLIENSIRHIERLKQRATDRNGAVIRLRQKLTQSRIIRVKRENKLEQKLKEMAELKEKYEKVKKFNEKQIKIAKGVRLALNAEKQKVKSSENVARGLEQTRRAFDSLKSQAGQLMALLRDKENEIVQLTSKLEELENSKNGVYLSLPHPMTSQDIMTSQVHAVVAAQASGVDAEVQTDMIHCDTCRSFRNEAQTWKTKYDKLYADFEDYRIRQSSVDASHQLLYSPVTNERGPPQDHHYGRRRMHAPYTSPDSYGRVSRPPLRRRLNHEAPSGRDRSNHKSSPYAAMYEPHLRTSDILLSPIEENEENIGRKLLNSTGECSEAQEDDSVIFSHESQHVDHDQPRDSAHDQEMMSHGVHHEGISSSFNELKASASSPGREYHFVHEISSSVLHEQSVEMNPSPNHDSGISSGHENGEYSLSVAQPISKTKGKKSSAKLLTKSVRKPKSSDEFPPHKLYNHPCVTKTSYLEVGASKTPSPSTSVNSAREVEVQEESPLCMNSFIRYNESEDTASEQSSLPHDKLDFSKETNSVSSDKINPEQNTMNFGVLWHPAMAPSENDPQSQPPVWLATSVVNGNFFDTSAPNPLLRLNDVINVQDVITNKTKQPSRQSRCVTYKGHKIDVTEFSIDIFREIIWSLDGGSESADDFIKFLASLAKKLNANPKWAGKHSMGNPKDWLGLRGLY